MLAGVNIPPIGKGEKANGDDFGVQLDLQCDTKDLTQHIWFAMYLTTELEAPKYMTTKVQKAKALQMCKSALQEVYSSLASCTSLIYIYRGKIAESLPL